MFYFGPEAAQDDTELLSYFHTTEQIKDLLNLGGTKYESKKNHGKNCIFITSPGGGKSALVKWLENGKHDRNVIVLPTSRTRFITDDAQPNVEDYRNLIKAELFAWMISELKKHDKLSKELQKKSDDYFKWSWVDPVRNFFSGKFEGLTILGFGFSLKASERNEYLRKINEDDKIGKASAILTNIASELKPVLVIEDPELIVGEGLQDDVSRDNAIRIGAFLSALATLHRLDIQVIVFIKEYILRGVHIHYGDFSQINGLIGNLKWTEGDLIQMISLRTRNRLNLHWNSVFGLSQKKFREDILPFMVNGPRDIIFVCNQAGKSGKRISESSLKRSINALRANKKLEIANQYNPLWEKIDVLSATICELVSSKHGSEPITREEFKSILKDNFSSPGTPLHSLRNSASWIFTLLWETPSIEERLFIMGCMGFVYEDKKVFSWGGNTIDEFNEAELIFINPLFVNT